MLPLHLVAPGTGKPDVEGLRPSNAGLTCPPKNGLAEKLKAFAPGLSPLRVSVPSTVERLSLSRPCNHRVRPSCGGTDATGGETGSDSAREGHTRATLIGSDVIRLRGCGRIPNDSNTSVGSPSTRGKM